MSHVTLVRIDGLAGRDEAVEFHLNRKVNAFYGLNGTGKTTLLRLIHSAMSLDVLLAEDIPFRAAQVCIHSITRNSDITHTLERASDGSLPSTWSVEDEFSEGMPARWRHGYLPASRLAVTAPRRTIMHTYSRASQSRSHAALLHSVEQELNTQYEETLNREWRNYTSQLLRETNRAQQEGLALILEEVLRTASEAASPKRRVVDVDAKRLYRLSKRFVERQETPVSLGTQANFVLRLKEDGLLQNVVSHIQNVEEKIDNVSRPRSTFERLIAKMFSGTKEVEFGDSQISIRTPSGIQFGVARLSSGEKHLLKILVAALHAESNSLIIDEPELSLHVDWQRSLIQSILEINPDIQVVLATHSPEVIADLADERIFEL